MNTFAERVHSHYSDLPEDALSDQRQLSWKHFLNLGFPTQKQEPYRYVRLRKLYDLDLLNPKHIVKQTTSSKGSSMVFVNGRFSSPQSQIPPELTVIPLKEALHTFGSFLRRRLKEQTSIEADPFAALNGAFLQEALFVYLPPNTQLMAPLNLIYTGTDEAIFSAPRIHFFLARHSSLTCFMQSDIKNQSWHNPLHDVALEEGAYFKWRAKLKGGWQTEAFRATLKKGSTLNAVSAFGPAQAIRQDYHISLLGEGSDASLEGAWHTHHQQEAHVNVLMRHRAPNTTSNQKFKGVLEGQSRSSFAGKIWVDPIAQKTQSYQQNHNLLLSDTAKAYAMPNLEIFADDVKASHGATVGQLDPEHLFYLKSRGLTTDEAKRLLVEGFTKEITKKIPS